MLKAPAGSLDLVQHFVSGLQNALARLPHEYALGEADFRTCLTSGLLGAASDAVTGFAASHIGELVHPGGYSQGGIPVPVALGLHAANGALGAGIRGEDPLSGAVGAALGEAAGMLYHHVRMRGLQRGTEEYDRALSHGADVARMAAALACIPLNLDAGTASRAAGTAAENNAMGILGPGPLDTYDEAVGQAVLDGAQAICDTVLKPAARGVNSVNDTFQDHLTRAQTHVQSGLNALPPHVRPFGERFAASVTASADIAKFAMETVRLPETGRQLATELAGLAGGVVGGKAVKAASPYCMPYLRTFGANLLEKSGAARFFLKKEVAPLVSEQIIARAIASKTGTPLASLGGTTTADLAASRFARAEPTGAARFFGKKGTSSNTGASSSMPHMENQLPYDPRAMEQMLRSNNPGQDIVSSTLPSMSMPNVKYFGRSVEVSSHPGIRIAFDSRGLPVFDPHAIMDVRIPRSVATALNSEAHKRAATRLLREEINMGRISKDRFTQNQLKDIKSGKAQIDGLTWHHHQDRGRMQLIDRDLHDAFKHVGGDSLWAFGQR